MSQDKSMLKKLSRANAKRQFREYSLYFITLFLAVSFLYAFCALLFSESLLELPELELLPYLIVVTTLLIVFVLGFLVSYMTGYMLKRRSRELGLYMVFGISVRMLLKMLFYETLQLGALAFLAGLPAGLFFFQLLEAVLRSIYGMPYTLSFVPSLPAVCMTFLCFAAIFGISVFRTGKWVKKVSLRRLLAHEQANEAALLQGGMRSTAVFRLALVVGAAGFYIWKKAPFSQGFGPFFGVVCFVCFLLLFFVSVPSYVALKLQRHWRWKYRKESLLLFRFFAAKIRSMSMSMGILSMLLLISVTFLGSGITAGRLVQQSLKHHVFDILIVHAGRAEEMPDYDGLAAQAVWVEESHTYPVYESPAQDFRLMLQRFLEERGNRSMYFDGCREHQKDLCIVMSDYQRLRRMLGYPEKALEEDSYYIHCVPALLADVQNQLSQRDGWEIAGHRLTPGGVFSEPFSQNDFYGNGYGILLILPDDVVRRLPVCYSLYAARTKRAPDIASLLKACPGLSVLNRGSVRSDKESGTFTALTDQGADYLSGRWAEKRGFSTLDSLLVCLFYLAVILLLAGAVVLSVQLLGNQKEKSQQSRVLWQLGMKHDKIRMLDACQYLTVFLLPAVPALLMGSALIVSWAGRMHRQLVLPVFLQDGWILQSVALTWLLFGMLYGIYYAAVCGTAYAENGRSVQGWK